MHARHRHLALLVASLSLGCKAPDAMGDEVASESDSGTTGEPDPCEGLEPSLPLFDATALYFSGQILIGNCDWELTVPIAEDQLVEGTDADFEGSYRDECNCGDEFTCNTLCGGQTRVTISHVDEHCIVGTLSEALGGGTETDTETDSGTETGEPPSCMPSGGFVIRR